MSDYALQAEQEIWDLIAANDSGESEEEKERRLGREIDTKLGTFIIDVPLVGAHNTVWQPVRVEVTYQRTEHTPEQAGHYIVQVPQIDPTGDEDTDLANHPATLAAAEVNRRAHITDHVYFSIDEVYPA